MPALPQTSISPPCRHANQVFEASPLGELFRDLGEAYIRTYRPCRRTIKLIRAIRVCRTPALGGQRITCKGCGHNRYQYHSCGHSHCPQCHGIKRLRWQDKLRSRMLPVPYCHITFTLPHDLNGLARRNQRAIYNLLFRSAWKTVKKLCGNPKNVGGLPGMSAVLHIPQCCGTGCTTPERKVSASSRLSLLVIGASIF